MKLLIFLLIVGTAACFGGAVYLRRREERRRIGQRMKFYSSAPDARSEGKVSLYLRGLQQLYRFTSGYIGALLPRGGSLDRRLTRSGVALSAAGFLTIVVSAALAAALLGGSLGGWRAGALGAAGVWGGSMLYLEYRIGARRDMFHRQLGDVLLMMANALRSGFSFLQAVELVSQDMGKPASEEFGRLLQEVRLGVPMETALESLSQRLRSEDLDLIITAVLIQRQVGGNLAQIFDTISAAINERLRMRREIKTITAQGRMSGWVLGLMPVGAGVFMYMMNPDHMKVLIETEMGNWALIAGFVLEIIGIILIQRIVNIKL